MTDPKHELLIQWDKGDFTLSIEAHQARDGRWNGVVCRRSKDDTGNFAVAPPFVVTGAPEEIRTTWMALSNEEWLALFESDALVLPSERRARRRTMWTGRGCLTLFLGFQVWVVVAAYGWLNEPTGRLVPVVALPFMAIGATWSAIILAGIFIGQDVWVFRHEIQSLFRKRRQ